MLPTHWTPYASRSDKDGTPSGYCLLHDSAIERGRRRHTTETLRLRTEASPIFVRLEARRADYR